MWRWEIITASRESNSTTSITHYQMTVLFLPSRRPHEAAVLSEMRIEKRTCKRDFRWYRRCIVETESSEPEKGTKLMAIYKRGGQYWYEFVFEGRRIRRPAKTRSRRPRAKLNPRTASSWQRAKSASRSRNEFQHSRPR